MRWLLQMTLCLSLLVGAQVGASEPRRLVAPLYGPDNINHDSYYYSRLLRLALDKTVQDYGTYHLVVPDVMLVSDRLKASIMQGYMDVAWFTTDAATEQKLRAVAVPLLGEINHYRLLLIRREDQSRFAQVKSLEDLRQFTGGVSEQWPDAAVMEANGLPFASAPGYGRLFRMLSAGRFDYFSRGLYQIAGELELFPELDLAIEQTLMLAYPNHVYFFVHRDNEQLAERLEAGLQRARADGSWQALFESIPRFQWAVRELQHHQRRVLQLTVQE